MISSDRCCETCFGAFFLHASFFVTPQERTCCALSDVFVLDSWRFFFDIEQTPGLSVNQALM